MSSERPAAAPLPGLLLVLSAPSGAGKTTLAHRFREAHPEAMFSVSATTRAPRGAERDGVDYHFITAERFAAMVEQGAFAEWAEVHGERYGTLRATVEGALARGQIALFDVDVQGGSQIEATWPGETATVFLLPPGAAELERRLRGRSTDSDEVIRRRLIAARAEVARGLASYDFVVVNDDLEHAHARLEAIVRHERARRAGRTDPQAARIAASCRRGEAAVGDWAG
jgi:guanylate kinase